MEEQNWYVNILELLAVKLNFADFYKGKRSEVEIFPNRKDNGFKDPVENRGKKKPEAHRFKQRDIGLSVFSENKHYSRISSQCNKYSGRLPVKSGETPFRMKIKYPSFSQDLQNIWKTKDRPICILSLTSSYSIQCMDVRSIQSGHRCNATNWSKKLLYAFPPFCLICRVLQNVRVHQTEKWFL